MTTYTEMMMKVINNEPLSVDDKEQLRVMFQEMDNNRQVVSKWIGIDSKAYLDSPTITNPDFRSSPLHVFHAYMTTPVAIAHNTTTPITFDLSKGDSSVFGFYNEDMSKIALSNKEFNVTIDGTADWVANADGYRVIGIGVYDVDDVLIASKEICVLEAVEQAGIPNRVNYSYTEDILGIYTNCKYFKMFVKQESGGSSLDLGAFKLSVRVA